MRSSNNNNTTTTVTFHNLKQARQGSGLVRAAFSGSSGNGDELPENLALDVPEKYNHPAVMRFLETGVIAEEGLIIDDIPAIMNAANYWDIPDLLRFCGKALMGDADADLPFSATATPNATPLQRRQFIELMHRK